MSRLSEPVLPADERRRLTVERLDAVRRLLARQGAAGVLLSSRRTFAWLTVGGLNHVVLATETGVAPVLVTAQRALVLAPVNEAPRIADEELSGLPLEIQEVPWWEAGATAERARGLVGRDVLDEETMADELTGLRERLTAEEHARLSWLGALTHEAVWATLAGCGAGTTEHDLAGKAVSLLAAHGARCPVLLVAADERIERYRHPIATHRSVQRRVMLVVVAERWGLHAALTGLRELEEPPAELRERNEAAAELLAAMRTATEPGRTLGDVLSAAQARYAALGFGDEWRLHHQGGSIGYAGRERIATPGHSSVIEPGMAFAWNPSIRGAKAEETFYLDATGARHIVTN